MSNNIKEKEIIKVKITGIQKYGAIYAEVLNIDDSNRQIKLSIKDIDYKKDGVKLKRMAETKSGFAPLRDNLDNWINDKIKEITDNF